MLFYHEIMFNTLAYQNNLKIDTPSELSSIHYRTNWNINNLNYDNLYHPIKDINIHHKLRCDNRVYFENLFNNINYNHLKKFHFNQRTLLPEGFNFNCYRQYTDMEGWTDENILWHWFKYGHSEDRVYKY